MNISSFVSFIKNNINIENRSDNKKVSLISVLDNKIKVSDNVKRFVINDDIGEKVYISNNKINLFGKWRMTENDDGSLVFEKDEIQKFEVSE